ncbi:MAG: hypothetical protein ABUL71_05370 [Gemmatimonadota bacterium]
MKRARLLAVGLGIGLAIVAVATNNRYVTWAAIVALVTALVLRLLMRRRQP